MAPVRFNWIILGKIDPAYGRVRSARERDLEFAIVFLHLFRLLWYKLKEIQRRYYLMWKYKDWIYSRELEKRVGGWVQLEPKLQTPSWTVYLATIFAFSVNQSKTQTRVVYRQFHALSSFASHKTNSARCELSCRTATVFDKLISQNVSLLPFSKARGSASCELIPRMQAFSEKRSKPAPCAVGPRRKKLRRSVDGGVVMGRGMRSARAAAKKKNIAYRQPRSLDSLPRSGIKSFRWFYALISPGWSRGYPLYNTYTLTESSTALADLDSPASTSRSSSPEELGESALPPNRPSSQKAACLDPSLSVLFSIGVHSSVTLILPSSTLAPAAREPMCFRASHRPSVRKVDESIYRSTQRALRYGKVDFDNLVTLYCIFIQFHGH